MELEERGNFFALRVIECGKHFMRSILMGKKAAQIIECGKHFMRSMLMGKNAAQWLMNKIKKSVIEDSAKQFFTFRDGDIAYKCQRSSNAFDQYLTMTELIVGG